MDLKSKIIIGSIGLVTVLNAYAGNWELFSNVPSAGIKSTNSPVTLEIKTGKFDKQNTAGQIVVHIPLAYAKKHGYLKQDILIENDSYKITNSVGYLIPKYLGRKTLLTPLNQLQYVVQDRKSVTITYAMVDEQNNRVFDNKALTDMLGQLPDGKFGLCILSLKQKGFCDNVIQFESDNAAQVMKGLKAKF